MEKDNGRKNKEERREEREGRRTSDRNGHPYHQTGTE